jgi:hypothetical protein
MIIGVLPVRHFLVWLAESVARRCGGTIRAERRSALREV